MEGGDRRIEGLGGLAHGAGADPPAEDGQQDDGDLAGRQPEHEASQDHAVGVGGVPGVGAHRLEHAPGSGARHRKLDLPELRHQPPPVRPIAPVRLVPRRHLRQAAVHGAGHPPLQHLLQGGGGGAIVLAPFNALGLHGFHHPERAR